MKKLFCLTITAIILFASVSCVRKNNLDKNPTLDNNHIENSSSDGTSLNVRYNQISKYMTFEELLDTATDIIKGKCVGVDKQDDYDEYEFTVVNRYLGEEVDSNIFVYVPHRSVTVIDTDYSYNLSDLSYKEGTVYYLILSRYVDVYLPHDRYMNVGGNLFMPANDVSYSKIYGEALINHAQTNSINTEKDLTDYLSDVAKKTPAKTFEGTPYITDTDMDAIIDKSDFILKVKIGEEVYKGVANDRCTYDCFVTRSIKGPINNNELIRIVFPKESVTEGNEYVLALTEFEGVSPRSFVMSSKNSIFELPSLEHIEKHLMSKQQNTTE